MCGAGRGRNWFFSSWRPIAIPNVSWGWLICVLRKMNYPNVTWWRPSRTCSLRQDAENPWAEPKHCFMQMLTRLTIRGSAIFGVWHPPEGGYARSLPVLTLLFYFVSDAQFARWSLLHAFSWTTASSPESVGSFCTKRKGAPRIVRRLPYMFMFLYCVRKVRTRARTSWSKPCLDRVSNDDRIWIFCRKNWSWRRSNISRKCHCPLL